MPTRADSPFPSSSDISLKEPPDGCNKDKLKFSLIKLRGKQAGAKVGSPCFPHHHFSALLALLFAMRIFANIISVSINARTPWKESAIQTFDAMGLLDETDASS